MPSGCVMVIVKSMVAVTLPFTERKLVDRTDEIRYPCTEKPWKYCACAGKMLSINAMRRARPCRFCSMSLAPRGVSSFYLFPIDDAPERL